MRPPPTAAEVEQLAEAFRQSPRSTAFVPLADAYLQLGRPRDAIDVLMRGVEAHPDLSDARLALGRAYSMLHQWMEAQAELLRAVKLDRQNRDAFRLLGEVLMRSSDFERALQVLQHAYNLNPADAQVLGMLKRAREGRPLDPPPPVPQARPAKRPEPAFSAAPTKVASPDYDEVALDAGEDDTTFVDGDPRKAKRPSRPPLPAPAPTPAPVVVAPPSARPAVAARSLPPLPRPQPAPKPAPPPATPARGDATIPDVDLGEDGPSAPLGRVSIERQRARAVEEKVQHRHHDDRESEAPGPQAKRPHAPIEDPFRPITIEKAKPLRPQDLEVSIEDEDEEAPAPAPSRGPAAPTRPEMPRPRLERAPHKQEGEGADAMRRSAAVGEDYLNQLLGAGLLSVPNVEARPMSDDGVPVRRWGRSRFPLYLVIWVLVLGGAGALTWFVVLPYLKHRKPYRVPDEVVLQISRGRADDLAQAQEVLGKAIAKDGSNEVAAAYSAEVLALANLLYGSGNQSDVEAAIAATARLYEKKKPDAPGQRELAVARAVTAVAAGLRSPDTEARLRDALREIERAMSIVPDDGTLRWLEGLTRLELGERDVARSALEAADAGGAGPPIARILLGDMKLDEGDPKGALEAYEAALVRADKHPLALVGRALVRIEQTGDADSAMQDLNVNLAGAKGTRLVAWKRLALGAVYARLEDYEKSRQELDAAAASGITEPRFLARVALARLDQGQIVEAVRIRALIRSGGDKQKDPVGALLAGELLLATGLPEDALETVGPTRSDTRARLVRGRALLDVGKPAEAEQEFAAILAGSPDDLRANTFRELARIAARAQEKQALEALQKLARASVSTAPRYVLGEAYALLGRFDDAKRELEASLQGNPLAYRARVRLADIHLRQSRPADAEKELRAALDQAPSYLPGHAALGRTLLETGKPDEAVEELKIAIDAGRAAATDELAYAEALASVGQKDAAKEAVRRAKDRGAPADEVLRVAALIDPAFAEEVKGAAAPAPAPRRRRR